jgi:predicted nucleic acid-binding protein
MSGEYPDPVVLDTTVLSNFASTDGISLLTTVLESPVVGPAVRDELEGGLNAGHDYLAPAVDALDDGLPLRRVPTDENSQDLRDRLDPGEAESLRMAVEHNGTLATDDLAARKLATQRDVPVTGSIGLLVLGVKTSHLDRNTADAWLETWREQRGYHAPVETVTELLNNEP